MLPLTLCLLAPPELAPPLRPAQAVRLYALKAEFAPAEEAYRRHTDRRAEQGGSSPSRRDVLNAYRAAVEKAALGAIAAAELDPKSAAGFDALTWAIAITAGGHGTRDTVRAYELFIEHHAATHPRAGWVVAAIGRGGRDGPPPRPGSPMARLFDAVDKHPDRATRGQTALVRARMAVAQFREADESGQDDAAALAGPMDAMLDRLGQEFGDCPDVADAGRPPATLGALAARLRPKVRLHQLTPTVAGRDLDGNPLDLAEFRGKAVLLVLWTGRERSLGRQSLRAVAERYAGRPFAVVGLTFDRDPATGRADWEAAAPGWRSLAEPRPAVGRLVSDLGYGHPDRTAVMVIDRRGTVRDRRPYRHINPRRPRAGEDHGFHEPSWPTFVLDELVAEAEGKPSPSPAERLTAAAKAGREVEDRFRAALRATKGQDAAIKANEDHWAACRVWREEAVYLIRKFPTEPAAFDLLANDNAHLKAGERVALLKAHHWADPRMDTLVPSLAQGGPADRAFCEAVADSHPDRAVRGRACLDYGRMARIYLVAFDRPNGFSRIGTKDELRARADKYLTLAVEKYADVPARDGGTVGGLAAGELAGLKNLQALAVGGTAPDLAGEDLDGKPVTLSEYRAGRVCAVVYWGSWCGPCMRAVPKERALVEKYAGQGFCILGVNGGDEKPAAKAAADKSKMLWPSLWDGGKAGGALAAAWNVQSWPTIYLIDRAGVVRYVGNGSGLEEAVGKAVGPAAP